MNTLPSNLKEILSNNAGRLLSYKELYDLLNLPQNRSVDSRKALIKQLSLFCEIECICLPKKRPKLIIKKVYDKPILSPIHGNNRYQSYFDVAMLYHFKSIGFSKSYLTNIEILEATSLINSNFKLMCIPKFVEQFDNEVQKLQDGIWAAYHCLLRWANKRIASMENRGLLLKRKVFRLYYNKTYVDNEGKIKTYTYKFNVSQDSELEKQCLRIRAETVEELGWNQSWDGGWLPKVMYDKLERAINLKVKQEFADKEDKFYRMKVVTSLTPMDDIKLVEKIGCGITEALNQLNIEAQNKISKTLGLDYLTGTSRRKLIADFIDIHTTVDYFSKLKSQ